MSFASYTYAVFLALLFLAHWSLPARMRKPLLVVASYVFYCSWDWRFGFLLLAVSVFSWAWGLLLSRRAGEGRLVWIGVAIELLPLLYFKYTNFALGNLAWLARAAGGGWHFEPWHIILPLGVSFFTFQGIAYLVDVATGDRPFTRLGDFLLYKGFWPQLIAGPIIRPEEIRDQIETPRQVSYDDLAEGTRRILSGLFKKVVVADTLAPVVDAVFLTNAHPGFVDTLVGVAGFSLQIYCDFAGYSEIAIGSARLFGYRFPENFDWPYLARSPQEFWNRWHMTLSRWIRDYVFTPLTFAFRSSPKVSVVWLAVAMALCGLWHGAAWTFVLWGVWHGALLVLNQTLLKPLFAGLEPGKPARRSLRSVFALALTWSLVCAGWLLFRAQNLGQVGSMARAVLRFEGGLRPTVLRENDVLVVAVFLAGLFAAELALPAWKRAVRAFPAASRFGSPLRAALVVLAILAVVVFDRQSQAFVYFQF